MPHIHVKNVHIPQVKNEPSPTVRTFHRFVEYLRGSLEDRSFVWQELSRDKSVPKYYWFSVLIPIPEINSRYFLLTFLLDSLEKCRITWNRIKNQQLCLLCNFAVLLRFLTLYYLYFRDWLYFTLPNQWNQLNLIYKAP